MGQSQWPSGLRRGSAADRFLELRVRIPPGAWMSVLCVLYTDEAQRTKQNRAGGMDVCLLSELCVKKRSLRGADHLSRGVLPTVVCYCV